MAVNKKGTPKKGTNKNPTINAPTPIAPVAAGGNEAPKRVGRPPKKTLYEMIVVSNGVPIPLRFEDLHDFNVFFKKAAYSGASKQPAMVTCEGKEYAIATVDYVVR